MASLGGVGVLLLPLPCTQGMAAFSSFSFLSRLGMVDKTKYIMGGSASFEEDECASEGRQGKKRLTCICTPACDNAGQLGRDGGRDVNYFLCL